MKSTHKNIVILSTAVIFCLFTSILNADEKKSTNIILIMADDVGYECFGCYGSQQYKTPHLDKMAQRGARFTHCYSQPLCTPSRVKLMTGLYNSRNYSAFSILNRDQKTIGQYFQEAGYRTMAAGKWQLLGAANYPQRFQNKGTEPQDAGFDKFCLWQVDRRSQRYWNPLLNIDGENRRFGKDDYGPQIATDYILDFMETNRDRPFFVYYPMMLVHDPFLPTPDSKSRQSKNRQKNFEDMVTYMDKIVGQIVQKTEELEIAENTLILFIGDNGTHKTIRSTLEGRTIQGGKALTTDAGTRVPMIAYQKGTVVSGAVSDDLVDFSDFLPTVMEATSQKIPSGLDGRSFLPQLLGKPGNPRPWIYCYYCPRPERTPPVRFVRDQRWKLYGDGRFYDVRNDPLEKISLVEIAAGTDASKAKEKLAAALAATPEKGETLLKFAP